MKKLLLIFLVVLTLVTAVIPAMAAEDKSIFDIVQDEVSNLVDVSKYKEDETDGKIYLISAVETDYTSKGFSDTSYLYLYFYNPSRKTITSSVLNSVNIATAYDSDGKPTSFKKHNLILNLNGASEAMQPNQMAKKMEKSSTLFVFIR